MKSKSTRTLEVAAIKASNEVTKAIQPKPTKTEIIKALALREQERQVAATKEAEAAFEVQSKVCEALLRDHVARNYAAMAATVSLGYCWSKSDEVCNVSVDVAFDNGNKLPANIERELRKLHAIEIPSYHKTDLAMIERRIRKEMAGVSPASPTAERVKALLASDEVKASLDAMLDHLHAASAANQVKQLN